MLSSNPSQERLFSVFAVERTTFDRYDDKVSTMAIGQLCIISCNGKYIDCVLKYIDCTLSGGGELRVDNLFRCYSSFQRCAKMH